jgi:hypothetical protein
MTWSGVIAWPTRGNIAGRLKTDPQHPGVWGGGSCCTLVAVRDAGDG